VQQISHHFIIVCFLSLIFVDQLCAQDSASTSTGTPQQVAPKDASLQIANPITSITSATTSNAVFDDFSDKLAQAKTLNKPLLLFLVDDASSVSKKIELECMTDPAVTQSLNPYILAHIDINSSQGKLVGDYYGWRKGPFLAVLNKQGEAFDALNLSVLTDNLVTTSLSSQIAQWIDKNAKRFQAYGSLGYTQTSVSTSDPILKIISDWSQKKKDYKDAPEVILLDQDKAQVQPDGGETSHLHILTYIGTDPSRPIHEFTMNLWKKAQTFHLVRARTITSDLKENSVNNADVEESPSFRNLPSLDQMRTVKFTFPGAKKDTFTDLEMEVSTPPLMPGQFFDFWAIEYSNSLTLYSNVEIEIPSSLFPQYREVRNSVPVKQTIQGDKTILTWTGKSEHYNPPRADSTPSLPVSAYIIFASKMSWGDIGKWFLSLTDSARAHSPELDAWIAKRTEGILPGPDYERRLTDSLLTGIYSEFRYLALNLSDTGFQPHPIIQTFQNKYGDCKDLSLFLQECLKQEKIQSDLVLLNPKSTSDFNQELPRASYFTHCILRVNAGDKSFFVDPTSHLPAGVLPIQDKEITGLLCASTGCSAIDLPPVSDKTNSSQMEISFDDIDQSNNKLILDLNFNGETKLAMRAATRVTSGDEIQAYVKTRILGKLGNINSSEFTISGDDDTSAAISIHLQGTTQGFVTTSGDLFIAPALLLTNGFFSGLPDFLPTDHNSQARVLITGFRRPPSSQTITYLIPTGLEILEPPQPLHVETDYFTVDRTVSQDKEKLKIGTSITRKFVKGEPRYVYESELPANAKGLIERLSQPVVFRKSSDQSLREACVNGDLNKVTALLNNSTDVEKPDSQNLTLLTLAARAGHAEVVKYLLSKGAKIEGTSQRGQIPLQVACAANKTDSALALIAAGADCNNPADGWTDLMYAAWSDNIPLINALLDHHANINAQGNEATPLLWAVKHGKIAAAELLLSKGANPTLEGHEQKTPGYTKLPILSEAAENGHLEMVNLLLKYGMNVDIPATDGETPLMRAAEKSQLKVMETLLDHGAKINGQDPTLGYTALFFAVGRDQLQAVDFLIQHGADLNIAKKTGGTALVKAAARGDTDIVHELIKAKADLNAVDHDGQTALIHSCQRIEVKRDSIHELVEAGANIDVVDNRGETALTYAGDRGHSEIVDYLKAKGAKRTDLHIILTSSPITPLAPAHAWALGVAAIYMQQNGQSTQFLGGYTEKDRIDLVDSAKNELKDDWEVNSKPDLLYQLEELKNTGHRSNYLTMGQSLTDKSDAEFQNYISNPVFPADKVEQIKNLRAGYAKWKERMGLAWDLCRYVNMVSEGYTAGYLNDSEAWALIMPVAQQTQKSFASWQEMGQNFLDGRQIWSGERNADFDSSYQLLANPKDPNSPWNRSPWSCDLSQSPDAPTVSVH
jgi:ankyrin repeat protein